MNVQVKYLTPDSLAELRDWLHGEAEAWVLPAEVAALVKTAALALRSGRCFDFGVVPQPAQIDACDAHVDAAVSLVERGSLGLPYDIFVGLARFTGTGGEDGIVMIVAETDDGVRPHRLLHFSTGTATRPASRLNQWQIGYGDSGHFFLPAEGRDAGRDREAERHFRRLALLLGLIADRRIPQSRIEAPAQLNKARRARGRPAIPACWKIDAASWVTRLAAPRGRSGESRGGHHRPPVAHDRRGHQRRLRSGKTTWVRSSRVGEILKHLARHRAFYELPRGEGQ